MIRLVGLTFVFAAPPTSTAALITTIPSGLSPGDQYRLVFVTSSSSLTFSTDIATYNSFVDTVGDTVLPSDWTAIVSTGAVDARTNTSTDPTPPGPTGVPIYTLNDRLVANDYDDLWDGFLATPIEHTETGERLLTQVWTGSNPDGTRRDGAYVGLVTSRVIAGSAQAQDNGWITFSLAVPGQAFPLYALSGVLEVPGASTAVPEPDSLLLASLAAVGLLVWNWSRKRKAAGSS